MPMEARFATRGTGSQCCDVRNPRQRGAPARMRRERQRVGRSGMRAGSPLSARRLGRRRRGRGLMVKAVSEFSHRVRRTAQGGDGLGAHLRNDVIVDVRRCVAEFHLDEFDAFFNTVPGASAWTWGRITAHETTSGLKPEFADLLSVCGAGCGPSISEEWKVPQWSIRNVL